MRWLSLPHSWCWPWSSAALPYPFFLGLLGGITGIFISSKGFGLLWPYSLMQLGMNSNKSADVLAGSYGLFAFSCIFWLGTMFLLAWLLLKKRDVRA